MRKFFIPLAVFAVFLSGQMAHAGFSYTQLNETFNKVGPTYGPVDVTTGPGSLLTADYDPSGFQAQVLGFASPSSDITDGLLNFRVNADNGMGIEQIDIMESGAIIISGDAKATYTLTVDARVTGIDGNPVSVDLDSFQVNGSATASEAWNFDISLLVLDMYLDDKSAADPLGQITEIEFAVDNTLIAETFEAGASAFIDKKDFTVTVPEPSSFLFLGAILTGTVLWQKRRNLAIEEDS